MTDATHYEFQARQRLTTDALNEQDGWTGRVTQELLRRAAFGDVVNVSGVVSGLKVNVVTNTLNIQISGGLAVFYDSTGVPPAPPASAHRWIEVTDSAPLGATLDGGGANPRWDIVEIAPGSADGPVDILDIYDPTLGAPVGTPLAPLKICAPVLTVRKGTEGANPKLPAGTTGCLPLAYIYVAAGAILLDPNRVMYCRPIILPRVGVHIGEAVDSLFGPHAEPKNISGGGLTVENDGDLLGTLKYAMSGTFANGGLPFYLPVSTLVGLSTVGNYAGGGLPVIDTSVNMYVAPPPYPAGYDASLAPRELFIFDTATPGINATIPPGAHNCIVVGALTKPTVTAQGPMGSPNATTSFIDVGIFGNYSLRRSNMLYIGAMYWDTTEPGFVKQRITGNMVGGPRKSGDNFGPDLPIAAPAAYVVTQSVTGQPLWAVPSHCNRVRLVGDFNIGSGTHFYGQFTDQFETAGSDKPVIIWSANTHADDLEDHYGPDFMAHLDSLGRVVVVMADGNLVGDCFLYVYEYEDSILALR